MAKGRQNIVGAQVRKARCALDLSQEQLAARLGRLGWDISRGTLAKIEAGVRCVSDWELLMLTKGLGVELDDLFPPKPRR